MDDDATEFDPFDAPLDAEEEQESLIAALQMLRGFGLFFAVTNSATERNRRMDAVTVELPDKTIQRVAVNSETENLLWHLREVLTDPHPDAVFVYGLENWISGTVRPRSIPFLLNLNAARDSFPLVLAAPLVMWMPQYVINAITNAAPDFFSVRSGVYRFPMDNMQRVTLHEQHSDYSFTGLRALTDEQRLHRQVEIEGLIAEYRLLSDNQRDDYSLAILQNELGLLLQFGGNLEEAETAFHEAASLIGPDNRVNLLFMARVAHNLGYLYKIEKRYTESASKFRNAIDIYRQYDPDGTDVATTLNALGVLYGVQNLDDQAEQTLREALDIRILKLSRKHFATATTMNNLARVLMKKNQLEVAERLFKEALDVRRAVLHTWHPLLEENVRLLSELYITMGRYSDAIQNSVDVLGHENKTTQYVIATIHSINEAV